MARDAAAPDASSNLDNRVRAHSVVVTLLILTVGFTLVGQLSDRLAASSSPSANASPPGGSAGGTPSAPGLSPTPQPTPVDHRPQFIYAAGDIADCPDTVPAVPDLVRNRRALILAVGDIVYPSGAARGFKECFDPLWGDLKARIRPVPGNHDYKSGVATGYYDYFGAAAGDVGRGWYSFDMGTWHIIAINSMCQFIGGCRAGSPQLEWLAADLAAHPAACTLAFWHHPRFSSGNGASPQRTEALWQALYAAGAEVVLNGHDHDYERFTPMDPTGQVDPQRGIREFVVGTGGANLTRRVRVAAHSEIWTRTHHGLLEMTLRPGRYEWRFIATDTRKVVDDGSGTCH